MSDFPTPTREAGWSVSAAQKKLAPHECLPKRWLQLEPGQAAVTILWEGGMKQRAIAGAFGYSGPTPVNLAIAAFVKKWASGRWRYHTAGPPQNKLRKIAAAVAIKKYFESRDV